MTAPLTKADSTALWHAVDSFNEQVRAMKDMPGMAQHLPTEHARLKAAKAALRKVQALVRKPKAVKP